VEPPKEEELIELTYLTKEATQINPNQTSSMALSSSSKGSRKRDQTTEDDLQIS
jgi:hypothetical protein